jgi:oxepin-CoA hydrolase/3-oxo-5,6-dehydrosuberyl-CoA semialdehyde dehydrogenase
VEKPSSLRSFLTTSLAEALSKLTPDTAPTWGNMQPQDMIEHLVGAVKFSYGKPFDPAKTVHDTQKQYKQFLILNEAQPFPQNLKSPAYTNGLPPHQFADLEQAKQALHKAIADMYAYMDLPENQDKVHFNMAFGTLNNAEVEIFHWKHFTHHLKQFGLIA